MLASAGLTGIHPQARLSHCPRGMNTERNESLGARGQRESVAGSPITLQASAVPRVVPSPGASMSPARACTWTSSVSAAKPQPHRGQRHKQGQSGQWPWTDAEPGLSSSPEHDLGELQAPPGPQYPHPRKAVHWGRRAVATKPRAGRLKAAVPTARSPMSRPCSGEWSCLPLPEPGGPRGSLWVRAPDDPILTW